MNHTILGAGGSVGNALAYELLKSNQTVRLVSRSKYSMPGTESYKADITSYEETLSSVNASDIVYLCVGLPYDVKIWAELWPKIMQNTIDACKSADAKLIFFDNVYMYGNVEGKMTEMTPYNPCSKKGEIRAKLATTLENEIKRGNIEAIIARAADLYGPYATHTSLPYIMVFSRLMNGKKAQWMVDAKKIHSFSYTIDCAKGLVLLSKNDECFNQIWHLPTYNPATTGEIFIDLAAKELGVGSTYSVLRKWMIKMAGLFNHTVSELYEMTYQNEFDYHFDSEKLNQYFKYQPATYESGIQETIKFLKST
jgi:nucleoside-diphosphate-sugar epimerase